MADNIATTPGSGATIAADDVGGVLHQRVKLSAGSDGTATDVRDAGAGALSITSGSMTVGPYGWDGLSGVGRPLRTSSQDGEVAYGLLGAAPMLYNGATSDRQRGNINLTLLASAARTTETSSTQQTNYNHRGAMFFLYVSAASGTGGLNLRIDYYDPISGGAVGGFTFGPAVTTTGIKKYVAYPGATAVSADGLNDDAIGIVIPRLWRATIVVGDASSYTYNLAASMIV